MDSSSEQLTDEEIRVLKGLVNLQLSNPQQLNNTVSNSPKKFTDQIVSQTYPIYKPIPKGGRKSKRKSNKKRRHSRRK